LSETAGTIIKLLAALTSPKACIKYITVAAALVFSWKYIEPTIAKTQIPTEQLYIVTLLLGLGVGALFGQAISYAVESLWKKYESGKEKKLIWKTELKEENVERARRAEQDRLLLENIKSSFDYLHFEQKQTLRELTLKNETLDMSDLSNYALEKNGFIQKLVHVRSNDHLTRINPIINDFVKRQWSEEKEEKVKIFLEHNEDAETLLGLLDENNEESNSPVHKSVLDSTARFTDCVQGMAGDNGSNTGYWLWLEQFLFEEFEKQTGKSYVDEIFISQDRIIVNEESEKDF